jgi:hypothetical protein
MSIKTIITNNNLESATIGDKTFTRRTEGGQVIYDGASGGGGGGGGGSSWAVIQQAGTMSVIGSSNVSSVTDGGVGISTVNLSPGFDNANYGIGAVSTEASSSSVYIMLMEAYTTASSFRLDNRVADVHRDAIYRVVFGK